MKDLADMGSHLSLPKHEPGFDKGPPTADSRPPNTFSPSVKHALPGIAIIAAATIYMAWSTLLTWPDAIYDFGSQLYYPWQMMQGRHLYVDVAYFNGPLSQYFNAGIFAIFGSSIHTLMLLNGAILLGVIAMVYRLICRTSDAVTATVACVVFVIDFALSKYIGIGNYNWICPYTHEVTHGVALSLGMVLALDTFLRTGRARWLVFGSALLGLVFLTKAEIFAPAAGVFGLGLVLRWRMSASDPARRNASEPACGFSGKMLAACLPFAMVLLVVYSLIALQAGRGAGSRALLGTWPWVFDHRISKLIFYRHGLGVDDLSANIWRMILVGAASLALLTGAVGVGIAPRRWRFTAILAFVVELVVATWFWPLALQVARPWPVFVGLIAVIFLMQAWKTNREKAGLRTMLAVLAFGLLGKMLFNARPWQYGFSLAFPGAIVLVDLIVGWLPGWVAARGGSRVHMRWAGVALVAVVAMCLYANQIPGSASRIVVGTGSDQFMAGASGEEVNRVCVELDRLLPKSGTLAVMPQGLMLNFITRRADSIPVVNMMPPEVMSSGEDHIVEQLNAHPPDLIVLSEKDVRDGAFVLPDGDYHYGQKIVAWMTGHYQLVRRDPGESLELSIWRRTR